MIRFGTATKNVAVFYFVFKGVNQVSSFANTLKLNDQFSKPLQNVVKAMHMTLNTMEMMNSASTRDLKLSQNIGLARAEITSANKAIDKMIKNINDVKNGVDKNTNSQQKFNNEAQKSKGIFSELKGVIGGIVGFYSLKKGIEGTIGGAAKLQSQLFTIQGVLNNDNAGQQLFSNLLNYSKTSINSFEDMINNARMFASFTKDTKKLENLNKVAERLALLDPAQGLSGAGFAIKEALGGDFQSLRERFGFGSIERDALKTAKTVEEFTNKFDELLSKRGFGESTLEKFRKSGAAQLKALQTNFVTSFSLASQTALDKLTPVITQINTWFNSSDAQVYFNTFATGLAVATEKAIGLFRAFASLSQSLANNQIIQMTFTGIGSIINGIIDLIVFLSNAFTQFGDIVLPIIASATLAFLTYKGVLLATTIAQEAYNAIAILSALATGGITAAQTALKAATGATTIAQWALNAAMKANPIGLIISLVIGLIGAFAALVSSNETVRQAFANVFNFIADISSKVFGFIIDYIEGYVNTWIKGLNVILLGVNKLAEVSNNVLGTKFKTDIKVNEADFSGFKKAGQNIIEGIGDSGKRAIENFNIDKLKQSLGFNPILEKQQENLDNQERYFGQGESQIGNIKNDINIEQEDIKLLRDVAETEVVNKFTQLTPNISVSFGDVHETADVENLKDRIVQMLQEEISLSAEGSYA